MQSKFDQSLTQEIETFFHSHHTILIIDEVQNLDLMVIKTVLTRIGKFCKVILLGSMNQIDDEKQARKDKCDFERVIEKLRDKPYVGYVELVQSMRNPICTEIGPSP